MGFEPEDSRVWLFDCEDVRGLLPPFQCCGFCHGDDGKNCIGRHINIDGVGFFVCCTAFDAYMALVEKKGG